MDGNDSPQFKAGDCVVCIDDEGTEGGLKKGERYTLSRVIATNDPDDIMVYVGTAGWFPHRFALATPAPADQPALRFNASKPESDYILTYDGGIRAAFKVDFAYQDTLQALARLYRGTTDPNYVLDALRRETHVRSESIVHLIADTCERGSRKYARGNYLKGSNWRQYFQAAVRHAERIQAGKEHDDEGFSHRGNFVWNVLMACHCISTGLGTDDRIRPGG